MEGMVKSIQFNLYVLCRHTNEELKLKSHNIMHVDSQSGNQDSLPHNKAVN